MTMKGHCLCGGVQITLSAPAEFAEVCHCNSCRRATGAPLMAWAAVPRDAVTLGGDSLKRFRSSPDIERTFCGRCGTSMTLREEAAGNHLYVAIAVLEDAGACAPDFHIWRSDRLAWIDRVNDLPRYLHFKRDGILE